MKLLHWSIFMKIPLFLKKVLEVGVKTVISVQCICLDLVTHLPSASPHGYYCQMFSRHLLKSDLRVVFTLNFHDSLTVPYNLTKCVLMYFVLYFKGVLQSQCIREAVSIV